MIESLDLSVPVGGSGMFIQLHQNGAFQNVQPLWTKYCRLQKRLDGVHTCLGLCNDHSWLFKFAEECRRQNKDFEKELRLLANSLEESKAILETQIGEICSKMAEVDPALLRVSHTLVNPRMPYAYEASCFSSKKSDIAVLKRNAVVAKYSHLRSRELCVSFDAEDVPVPDEWTQQFPEIDFWKTAYKNRICRNRIQKMICVAKRNLLLP
jgi:hypothetical protein